MKAVKLIIFDLDGTLVNSVYDLADGVNHALKMMKKPLISYEQAQSFIGDGIVKLVERALGHQQTEEELSDALVAFKAYYHQNLTRKTKPYAGIIEVLNHLKAYKKAVYSNKADDLAKKVIKNLELSAYFDKVLGANPSLYTSKPSPDGVIYLLDHLGVNPEESIMIGDSTHDIHAAQKAGVKTCAVTYGYRSREQLVAEDPDYLVDNPEEILSLPWHD